MSEKTLRLSQVLTDLDGNNLTIGEDKRNLTLGRALCLMVLGVEKSPDPLRSYTMAQKMNKDGDISVDNSELQFLKDTVKNSTAFLDIVRGQVLSLLE